MPVRCSCSFIYMPVDWKWAEIWVMQQPGQFRHTDGGRNSEALLHWNNPSVYYPQALVSWHVQLLNIFINPPSSNRNYPSAEMRRARHHLLWAANKSSVVALLNYAFLWLRWKNLRLLRWSILCWSAVDGPTFPVLFLLAGRAKPKALAGLLLSCVLCLPPSFFPALMIMHVSQYMPVWSFSFDLNSMPLSPFRGKALRLKTYLLTLLHTHPPPDSVWTLCPHSQSRIFEFDRDFNSLLF